MESPLVASCERLDTRRVLDKMLLIVEVSVMVGNDCGENVSKSDRIEEAKPQKEMMEQRWGGRARAVVGFDTVGKRLEARAILGWLMRARMREFPAIYILELRREKGGYLQARAAQTPCSTYPIPSFHERTLQAEGVLVSRKAIAWRVRRPYMLRPSSLPRASTELRTKAKAIRITICRQWG